MLQLQDVFVTNVALVGQLKQAPLDCKTMLALHWQAFLVWLYVLPARHEHVFTLNVELTGQPAHEPPVRITNKANGHAHELFV